MRLAIALLALVSTCGPEATTFRTTDRGDERKPGAAAYEIGFPATSARVFVWSDGGFTSTGDEPMTHVGFEIENLGKLPIDFDGDALALAVTGRGGAALPPAKFSMVTPLGPAQVTIEGGSTTVLESYFVLPVRPRAVESMRVRWRLRSGDAAHVEESAFVRSDDYPVYDARVPRS